MKKQAAVTGNKVLFVEGPEAGNVRIVPESAGNHLKSKGDYIYRIWPIRLAGSTDTMHVAFAADSHPINMFLAMWREYSPAAQIKRDMEKDGQALTYQTVQPR